MESDVRIFKIKLEDGFDVKVNSFCKAIANPTDGSAPRKLISTFVYAECICLVTELAE